MGSDYGPGSAMPFEFLHDFGGRTYSQESWIRIERELNIDSRVVKKLDSHLPMVTV